MATASTVTVLTVMMAMIALFLVTLTAWSRRKLAIRLLALVVGIGFIPITFVAVNDLPSRPKLVSAKELRDQKACLLILHVEPLKEKTNMLVLVKTKDSTDVRYLEVSWELRFAVALQKAMRSARQSGGGKMVFGGKECQGNSTRSGQSNSRQKHARVPPTGAEDEEGDDISFYPDPVPELPPKDLLFYAPAHP